MALLRWEVQRRDLHWAWVDYRTRLVCVLTDQNVAVKTFISPAMIECPGCHTPLKQSLDHDYVKGSGVTVLVHDELNWSDSSKKCEFSGQEFAFSLPQVNIELRDK